VNGSDLEQIQDYSVLPVLHIKLKSLPALERLKANPKVKSIDQNKQLKTQLLNSLPLIGQPTVAAKGFVGAGTSVCVLDTGIQAANFSPTNAVGDPATSSTPFAMCTQGLTQTGCNVLVNQAVGGAQPTSDQHGTNVSAIVLGVAPQTKIVALNVFQANGSANTSDIIQGINFCTSNKATDNIVSLNMSLGDSSNNTSPVPATDAFGSSIASAITAGITVVVAAGNDGYTNAISLPAAYSGVVSVGAVYSKDWGGLSWASGCSDPTTAADRVTCFSDSASFLTVLAPGALITAAGIQEAGTSQATPHVAGAVAVMKSAYPSYTRTKVVSSLRRGPLVRDPKSGVSTPRLALTKFLPNRLIAHDFNGDGTSDIPFRNSTTGQLALWTMNGLQVLGGGGVGTESSTWQIIDSHGDYNGDGNADLLWRNTSTGGLAIWFMNGAQVVGTISLGTLPLVWQLADGHGDYNGDGNSDLLWRNTATGDVAIWLLNSTGIASGAALGTVPVAWQIVSGHGDYNGDGKSDILWRNTTTGGVAVWMMNGTAFASGGSVGTVPLAWQIVDGTSDYDGDGKSDLLWRNTTTGDVAIWTMNGAAILSGAGLGVVPVAWQIVGSHSDFDGDGKSDLLWRNTSTGEVAVWLMNGTALASGRSLGVVPLSWQLIAVDDDFNADGKADLLWQNSTTGDIAIWLMNGAALLSGAGIGTLSAGWAITP